MLFAHLYEIADCPDSKDQERAGAMVCQMPLTASRQPSR